VPDQVLQAQQQPMPAWLHQQAQHVAHPSAQQEPVQSAPEAAHAATKLPPGFAPVHYKGRPCTLLMLRGFCPMGDKCPYDHPLRAGERCQIQLVLFMRRLPLYVEEVDTSL
jgi:hypothetical protein